VYKAGKNKRTEMNEIILNSIKNSILCKQQLSEDHATLNQIEIIAGKLVTALKNNKRIYFCGNGGSAADAQHLAAELSGRFYTDRPALPAEALHCNTSYLTAVANDYSYDVVYQRLIAGIANEGDVLIGLSTSGSSKNIIFAVEEANKKKLITVGLTGSKGGQLKNICTHWIGVPSDDTPRIQESHILIGHILCQLVEENYFKLNS
jgi:D-sedoheptulose 7-phosphate isomerase